MLSTPANTLIRVFIPMSLTAEMWTCLADRLEDCLCDYDVQDAETLRGTLALADVLDGLHDAQAEILRPAREDTIVPIYGPAGAIWSAAFDLLIRRAERMSATTQRLHRAAKISDADIALTKVREGLDLLAEIERAPIDSAAQPAREPRPA